MLEVLEVRGLYPENALNLLWAAFKTVEMPSGSSLFVSLITYGLEWILSK